MYTNSTNRYVFLFLIVIIIVLLLYNYSYIIILILNYSFNAQCFQLFHFTETPDSCSLTQCGANAFCEEKHGVNLCRCLPNFIGNPLIACHLECVQNSDCDLTEACSNHKCVNPCNGACGNGASCDVVNHNPICYCANGLTGDPFVYCSEPKEVIPFSPCNPSPCGPNSRCIISPQGYSTCSCIPGFRGSPPLCSPECIVSSDCLHIQACINNKCVNPCTGRCGHGALCSVIHHNPVCSCPGGHQGDPFVQCVKEPGKISPNLSKFYEFTYFLRIL